MKPMILKVDVSGRAITWANWQEAATLYSRDLIAWTAGETDLTIFGGFNNELEQQSTLTINSIIAVKGDISQSAKHKKTPPLTNRALFHRDANLCLYCGDSFSAGKLTRDHVHPISQGGLDCWMNVVSACQACNTRKGACTPEEARMPLLAVPFVPNHAEYLVLSNRRILADQMEFLQKQFRKNSPLRGGKRT